MTVKKNDKIDELIEGRIQVEFLEKVMGERFGSYAKYIIQDRAIPDVRDGLKPVQRRILYAMKAVGMVYGEPYKKSARIVGEVIGKYHPHGDTSVYDALVRMSQEFKINVPLIDMHGNNGSIDGDSAAAMRYTEARLSEASMYLLKDIEKKTVQFVPNYDDSEIEPVVLPAKFPNLLVNGADGISAGYATNIPPHNLNETIELTIKRMNHPKMTVDEAMEIMPGPDFPTGGIISNSSELREAFETGRGKVVVRSKTSIEGSQIVINEIPYDVNKSVLVKKIDQIAQSKKVDGIIEVRDESDKEGLRIVIETKKESNPEVILNYLFKNTDLQVNFSYNMVAIVDRSPKLLGVLDIIDAYIEHAKEVTTNRSYFELDKDKKRLHIVDGLVKLVPISDEVIKVIRESDGKQDSKKNIMEKFGFSELQAEAIVTLQLYRLSRYDVEELIKEKSELEEDIKRLNEILSNETALKNVIIHELRELNQKIVTPRRSVLTNEDVSTEYNEDDLIIHEDVRVIITHDGYIRKLSLKAYDQAITTNQELGMKEGDYVAFNMQLNTANSIMLFTSSGYCLNIPVFKIPEIKYKELGCYVGSMLGIESQERIVAIFHIYKPHPEETRVLISTKEGKTKFVYMNEIYVKKLHKNLCMKMNGDDEVVAASIEFKDYDEVITITKMGYCLRYAKSEVPTSSAKALGVKSIFLKTGDEVITSLLSPGYYKQELLILTNRGGLKRVYLKEITPSKRNCKGDMIIKSVKTNPYFVVDAIIANPSKMKDAIDISILTSKGLQTYNGAELPKDTFENGIPICANTNPIRLNVNITDPVTYKKVINELSKDFHKSMDELKEQHPNSIINELGDIIEKQSSIFDYLDDDKDIVINKPKKIEENDDDDDDEINKLRDELF